MAESDANKNDNASVNKSTIGEGGEVKKGVETESHKTNNSKTSQTKTTEDNKSEGPQRMKNISTKMDQKIVDSIKKLCNEFKDGEDASKIAEALYKMLEKDHPKGWCVFAGAHFYGLCTHKDNMCIEFEIDDFRVGCFQTYVPE